MNGCPRSFLTLGGPRGPEEPCLEIRQDPRTDVRGYSLSMTSLVQAGTSMAHKWPMQEMEKVEAPHISAGIPLGFKGSGCGLRRYTGTLCAE